MYKKMSKSGAMFISVPSAFTETTGRKHWHTLLKARAIENISYISTDARGNKYEISSITGAIDPKNPDIINMKDVTGIIFLKDKKTINIYADTAKYNNKNYDSIFEKNVRVLFENHEIKGERLNLDFATNLMTMSKDVIYKNPETILKADRLVIDLITKSSKIFMDGTTKKVIAIYSN